MPNLQQWLNAWVKVNAKQQGSSPSAISPSNSRSHSNNQHRLAGKVHHSHLAKSGTTSQRSTYASKTSGDGRRVEPVPAEKHGKIDKDVHHALHDSTSSSLLSEQLHGAGTTSSATVTTLSSGFLPLSTSADSQELAAIRKFNKGKHKRRLHRTNSFSDLIREQATKQRVSRSGSSRHYSVERTAAERIRIGQGRRHSHTTSYDSEQANLYRRHRNRHHRSIPPPTTLHDPFVDPAQYQGSSSDEENEVSSQPSTSPTGTATTVQHSNKVVTTPAVHYHQNSQNPATIQAQHSEDSSNTALYGVADFFGTEIAGLRPTTVATASRHTTHVAQHGCEDEQPHYLRRANDGNDQQEEEESSSAAIRNYQKRTTISSSTTTRLHHHSRYQTNNNNNTHRMHHHRYEASPRPPLPSYRHHHSTAFSKTTTPRAVAREHHTTQRPQLPLKPVEAAEEGGLVVGGVRLPFFFKVPGIADNHSKIESHKDKLPFGVGVAGCQGCKVAQAELQHTQESLEYMRVMSIRKEYRCDKCRKDHDEDDAKADDDNNSNNERKDRGTKAIAWSKSPSFADASQLVSQVTARHQKQVAQLMKERNHWQRNMSVKLEKYANLCSNLNTEASSRIDESRALENQVKDLRNERDQMAGELEQLRAAVQVHEKEREDHRRLQDQMRLCEEDGLRKAREAVATRDDTIAKLTTRLAKTLDTLALEREQQRQRRQIIFPPTSSMGRKGYSNQMNGATSNVLNADDSHLTSENTRGHTTPGTSDEQEELSRLRAELLESQQRLAAVQIEAEQKQRALLSRCETLESKLEGNSTVVQARKAPPKETHPLSEKNGWGVP